MDASVSTERREFLKNLTLTTAAVVLGGCSGSQPVGLKDAGSKPLSQIVNQPPVWQAVPTITFTQGVRSTFSIASYVTDPNGDPLSINKNSAALPPGITYNAATKSFVYDGVGAPASTSGHVLTADDGKP